MWGQSQSADTYQTLSRQRSNQELHNRVPYQEPREPIQGSVTEAPTAGTTANASPARSTDESHEGTWGEREVGGIVDPVEAREGYQELQRTLSRLSQTRSERSQSRSRGILRTRTNKSTRSIKSRAGTEADHDVEKADGEAANASQEQFDVDGFMKEGRMEKRIDGQSAKKVGVVFRNLTVKGVGSSATFVRTLPDAVLGTFGPDLYRIITNFFPFLRFGSSPPLRELIRDFTGVVRDGEMMLVLGRPGSGCSTFLKVIANERKTYAAVEGDVFYGGIPAEEQAKHYRGEVSYNPENDEHMPNLTVWQTLTFNLLTKTRKRAREDVQIIIDALLKMFAMSHTRDTQVGNEYVRGVSGGERKRVSIMETLATKSTVTCWDNSTRGLDASTALDYANSLRIMTDVSDRTTITTLYQAGQEIYDTMDKVLVIEEGRMLYQGPASEARQYFVDLGFYAPPRQTTSDFLTSIADLNERQFRDGMKEKCPKTPEELEKAFRSSEAYKNVLRDVEDYEKYIKESSHADANNFRQSVKEQKSKTVRQKSPYTVSFIRQVMACTRREFWLTMGDTTGLYSKYFIIISCGLIVSSLFYDLPDSTEGTFTRGGAAFFGILFLGWLQLAELMKAVSGRNIIERHQEYAFYRPSAVAIARVIADFPMIFSMVIPFGIIMYWMTNFSADAGKFFIYLLFVYTTTICITSLYRMFASLSPTIDDAVRFSGIALNLLVIFTGYVIYRPQLLSQYIWFGWLYWVNPLSYAFEGVLTNEFTGRQMPCSELQLVPQGPNVQPEYQGCAVTGAMPGSTVVSGDTYVESTYNYSRSNLWRNWAVLIAFSVLYILITAWACEYLSFAQGGGGALIFKKSKKAKKQVKANAPKPADEEKGGVAEDTSDSSQQATQAELNRQKSADSALQELTKSESIFTWNDVEYTVTLPNGSSKKLLNKINGYAKPGVMVALMGASGAGKTTLLNTLSQRQRTGVVSGDMLVDGRPLGTEFQRSTGFVEQMDLHDESATIREALEFSALLRQDAAVPREEKIAYVDNVISLLELEDIQDSIIMSLGVEQKKRLTIGVELAAKPSLLLFLDEPTSGLDSQSAYSIVRFLKKLCAAGQAIVCTIHQPSSMLIQEFDMILALNPGGNTFYFGPVGHNGSAVVEYFAARGVQCPPDKNIAEFILETAIKGGKREDGKRLDWNKEWLESKENKELLDEIGRLRDERYEVESTVQVSDQREFAASTYLQTYLLTERLFKAYWRDPSYYYGKLFVAVIVGIFNGFTFWQLGNSTADMQNRMFTAFLIITLPATIINSVLPKFYGNRALWEARELPSRIYGWVAFCTANVVTEIPIATVSAVLYFVIWYFPTGLPYDSSTAGYVFLMTWLFFLFMSSWGQWICAFAPSFTVISNVLPFFLVMTSLFNGVVRPYMQIPVFWRYWMYYVNPTTWWIGGVLSATLAGQPVMCAEDELAHFNPPPGQTCGDYAGTYVAMRGSGYISNPNASTNCGFCQYASGDEYLTGLNIQASDKWRDFGIFLAFCVSNWFLVYFFIYTVRIKGWSFGMGPLFNVLGKAGSLITKPFSKKK